MVEYQQTETADRNAGDKRQRRHRADKYKAESNRQAKERNRHRHGHQGMVVPEEKGAEGR